MFYGCKKECYGNYVIQSSNHQKSIEEKITFIQHFACYIIMKLGILKFKSCKFINFLKFESFKNCEKTSTVITISKNRNEWAINSCLIERRKKLFSRESCKNKLKKVGKSFLKLKKVRKVRNN